MKKILCILIAVINLFACTQKEITVTVENLPVEDIPEEVLSYAETICSEGICAIGTGIRLNELKEGDILPSDATLFPLYRNGESDRFLLVRDKEYFTVPAQDIEEDGAFSVLLVDDSVYLVRKDGITPLVNGDIQAIGKEKAVQKLQECAMAKNPLGRKRRIVHEGSSKNVSDPDTGLLYSSTRIVISFEEGDTEEMIRSYERFCKGFLRSEVKGAGLYVFSFETRSYGALKRLREDSVKLSYVKSASLESVSEVPKDPTVTDK